MAGIFLESSSASSINFNTISGHSNAIHLGNSSPLIGANNIYDNKYHGLNVGSGSLPGMDQNLSGNPPDVYPLSGYNDIKENGGITSGGPLDNDGSEIFLNNSNVILESGCNSICDDRSPRGEHPPYNTQLLMNGPALDPPIEIYADSNYWSDNPLYHLEERFGNLTVYYEPVRPEPCEIPIGGGGGEGLVMRNSSGEVIDTFYQVSATIPELTETELDYAEAEEYFITGDLPSAQLVYQEIINSQAAEEIKMLILLKKLLQFLLSFSLNVL